MKRMPCLFSRCSFAILAGFLAGPGIAEAQLVQIGPGYVKAPFVRVYRTRNGTYVRAPFTQVEPGAPPDGRQLRDGVYAHPDGEREGSSYANREADAELSLVERQRRLIAGSDWRLNRDLRSFPTGSHWQAFLRLPPEFRNERGNDGRTAMLQPDPDAVQAVLSNFDVVAGSDQYHSIARLRSFRSTHRLLREYVLLLTLPSVDPLPPVPETDGERSVLIPPTVDQRPEELRLPE